PAIAVESFGAEAPLDRAHAREGLSLGGSQVGGAPGPSQAQPKLAGAPPLQYAPRPGRLSPPDEEERECLVEHRSLAKEVEAEPVEDDGCVEPLHGRQA